MQKIIQALLLTTLMAGLFCQKIVIDNSTLISPCTTGARSAEDTYLITGTIGDNITMALNQNWLIVVFIMKLRKTSPQYETVCQFLIGIGTCQSYPAIKCVCFYNTTTDQARFTLSDTVQADDSNAIIIGQWQHRNATTIYSNKNYTFPEIYDVNAAQLNLIVAGVTGNLPTSGSCSFSLKLNKSNDLELCCSKTAKPCYPKISFNGAVVTNNTETCVTYSASQLPSDGVTGNLVLSYSMCSHTDYRQGSSCTVTSKLGPFSQQIVIDNSTLISPCTTGARSAEDTYIITGTIGDNITMAVDQRWQTVVFIMKLKRTSAQYQIVCQFNIGIGTCLSFPAIKCVCFYNTTTDQARFTLSDTVQADDSNAIINVQWWHNNGTIIYSNKNYTFPEIYDMNAAQLNLIVAGVTGNLLSGSCSFSLTLNKSNDLELCCSNTATPCYPQISFNGAVVTNNTETCVTYPASQLPSDGVTVNLVLSYSMCSHTDYRQGSSCTVTSKPRSHQVV